MTLLDIKNVNKHFGGLQAVSQISFSVQQGMIKSVIGPNGAGKTTLLNLISGNLSLSSGQFFFDGRPIHGLQPYQIARRGISRTFQNIKLSPGMTALENIMVGRHTRSRAGFIGGMFSIFLPPAKRTMPSERNPLSF
jgi:branched-chain amino acid transport system ATP-binding protein